MRIEVKDLCFSYHNGQPDERAVLDNVSFAVASGSFTGIIGHTGSGKTTLVQQLNGLLRPASGHIYIGDTDITDKTVTLADIRRQVGLVFQYPEYQLFEETVAEDVAFGPKNLGLEADEIDRRVREALRLVELDYDRFAGRSPFELSGGQKRRVAMAGVLAMEPAVLILDEPAAGLDPRSHREIMTMVERIRREKGCTILLVSHNMDDVGRYCDQVLVLDGGRLTMQGPPEAIFARRDELAAIGLDVPAASQLLHRMRALGAAVDAGAVLTEEQAVEAVMAYLEEKA